MDSFKHKIAFFLLKSHHCNFIYNEILLWTILMNLDIVSYLARFEFEQYDLVLEIIEY